MCVNDVLTLGARPLFFLDYFSTGALAQSPLLEVVEGIADACKEVGCALIGGETAEMPGLYQGGTYDLAGFCVGVVERDAIINGRGIQDGDVVIGLGSNGLHSNGFSLAQKVVFERMGLGPDDALLTEKPVKAADALLAPTRLYGPSIFNLLESGVDVRGMAHITGGGLAGNLGRVIPEGLCAVVDANAWPRPELFDVLARGGPVEEREMRRTFNLGIGFALAVPAADVEKSCQSLEQSGESVFVIGRVEKGSGGARFHDEEPS
jgi:phosphoribosylformylglycinamidine cyclo-ligase